MGEVLLERILVPQARTNGQTAYKNEVILHLSICSYKKLMTKFPSYRIHRTVYITVYVHVIRSLPMIITTCHSTPDHAHKSRFPLSQVYTMPPKGYHVAS